MICPEADDKILWVSVSNVLNLFW